MTKSTLLSYFTTLSISKAHTLCHCCKTMTGYLARGRPCGGGAGGQVHAAATVLQRRHSAGICLHLVQSGPALFTLLGLPGCFFLSFFLVGGLLRIVYALVGALTIGYTNVKKCVPWCSAMHENCSASELLCIRPALHQNCSASELLCIRPALHQNCSASELICIRPALHQNCSASELLCIRTALHQNCTQACNASELLCIRTARRPVTQSRLLCTCAILPLDQASLRDTLLCLRSLFAVIFVAPARPSYVLPRQRGKRKPQALL